MVEECILGWEPLSPCILYNTNVYWENNHATLGGAIYVEDASPASYCTPLGSYEPKEECFFQLPDQNLSHRYQCSTCFQEQHCWCCRNCVIRDNCELTHGLDSYSSGEVFHMLAYNDYNTTSNISSSPPYICLCENSLPDCRKFQYDFAHAVYPGETFQVSIAAVRQRDGTVPSRVISVNTLITLLYVRMVWLYDANIDYLSGKYIPLFLVAMLAFLFLMLSCFSLVSGCRPYHTWGSSHGSTVLKHCWNRSWIPVMLPTKLNIITGLDCC